MPLSFLKKDNDLLCEGEGVPLLRLKTNLAEFLGSSQVRSLNSKSFSLPLSSAALASSVFEKALGAIPDQLKERIDTYKTHEIAREDAMRGVLENRGLRLDESWNDTLDPAQAIAVSAMITPGLLGLCLFDEQGIGKTVTTIAAYDILRQKEEVERLIIVCPVTMMKGWREEINKFLPGRYETVVLEGTAAEKRKKALSHFDVLVCNFESIPPLLLVLKGVAGSQKTVLAVDESFNVKNKEAGRSVAVRELRRSCVKGFVLCGTPAPNSSVDVIHQFDVADDGYAFAGFVTPKDEKELLERVSERIEGRGAFIRRLKEDVLPFLPEKNFEVLSVNMTGRQAALYEDARNKLEISLKSMDNAMFKRRLTTYFQQRAALLQICACPEAVDPSFSDESAKLIALDELVKKLVGTEGKKLIIWSFYVASLQNIFYRYKAYSPVLLDGSSTASERAEAVHRFQNDPNVRICVANPAAAGAGITLHAASDAVYVSFSNQAAHFLQSVDRIHRRGQTASSVDYHLLVCRGTIEETEVQRLRAKELSQHELLGDRVKWPNSLDEALSELSKSHV